MAPSTRRSGRTRFHTPRNKRPAQMSAGSGTPPESSRVSSLPSRFRLTLTTPPSATSRLSSIVRTGAPRSNGARDSRPNPTEPSPSAKGSSNLRYPMAVFEGLASYRRTAPQRGVSNPASPSDVGVSSSGWREPGRGSGSLEGFEPVRLSGSGRV